MRERIVSVIKGGIRKSVKSAVEARNPGLEKSGLLCHNQYISAVERWGFHAFYSFKIGLQ